MRLTDEIPVIAEYKSFEIQFSRNIVKIQKRYKQSTQRNALTKLQLAY